MSFRKGIGAASTYTRQNELEKESTGDVQLEILPLDVSIPLFLAAVTA